ADPLRSAPRSPLRSARGFGPATSKAYRAWACSGVEKVLPQQCCGKSWVQRQGAEAPVGLARIVHHVLAAKRRDRSEKAAPRSAGPRRTVRTSQGRAARYGLRSKRIGDFGRNHGE